MFRVWTKNLGGVGKSEAHVYCLALTRSDQDQDSLLVKRRNDNHSPGTTDAAEQLGKPFLLKGNFIFFSFYYYSKLLKSGLLTVRSE